MSLELKDIHCSRGSRVVLSAISLSIKKGDFVSLVGQNGSGKTTLFRCIASVISDYAGNIVVDDADVRTLTAKKRARKIAYLPQQLDSPYPFTVSDFILMSRYAHQRSWFGASAKDRDLCDHLIERLCLVHRKDSPLNQISGGELHRAFIAGALAQEAEYILLDEPTASLDPLQEEIFFNTIKDIRDKEGVTIFMSTHNITRVLSESKRVVALRNGSVYYDGTSDVLTDTSFMKELYQS